MATTCHRWTTADVDITLGIRMPLFTYILTFKSEVHVVQGSHSNFTGFFRTWTELPRNALPALSDNGRRDLSQLSFKKEFTEVPNQKHVWKKTFKVDGEDFNVLAVQTER
jgi:hypothetical protein